MLNIVERDKTIKELSEMYNGEIYENSFGDCLKFTLNDIEFDLFYDNDKVYGYERCTVLKTNIENKEHKFHISKMDFFDKVQFAFLKNNTKTMHKKFNREFHVKTNNIIKMKSFLDLNTCELLYGFAIFNKKNTFRIETHDKYFDLTYYDWITNNIFLKRIIDGFVEIIKKI